MYRPPPSSRGRRAPGAGLAALALAALLGGCRSADAALYNLRQVHDPDGTISRTGAPMAAFQYELRRALGGLRLNLGQAFGDVSADPEKAGAELIDDPLEESLDALLDLADCDSEDPRVGGLQVEAYAWLSEPRQPYVLSRERAVLELGAAGARLGVDGSGALGAEDEATPAAEPSTPRLSLIHI